MAEKRIISVSEIMMVFKDYMDQMKRGEYIYTNGNVVQVLLNADVRPALLKGEVRSSTTNRCYSTTISLDIEDGIVDLSCTCPRPQMICHHMAAVCFYSHYNIKVPKEACAWNNPTEHETETKLITISDIYPSKPYCAVERLPSESEIKTFIDSLDEGVGLKWLLSPPSDEEAQT